MVDPSCTVCLVENDTAVTSAAAGSFVFQSGVLSFLIITQRKLTLSAGWRSRNREMSLCFLWRRIFHALLSFAVGALVFVLTAPVMPAWPEAVEKQ